MKEQKKSIFILISLTLNVFFIAFLLGQNLPAIFRLAPPLENYHLHRFHSRHDLSSPPNPLFIIPEMILSKQEMDGELAFASECFEKIHKLRKQFAIELEKKDVSEEQILKHFNSIEVVMDELKNHMKGKIAKKIAAMSLEERRRFLKDWITN